MPTGPADIELILAPYRHLLAEATKVEKCVVHQQRDRSRDDYSPVLGISEVELSMFLNLYDNTLPEISQSIGMTAHEKLKSRLQEEFELFPRIDRERLMQTTETTLQLLNPLRGVKKLRNTARFATIITEICQITERMIQLHENVAWLDMDDQ